MSNVNDAVAATTTNNIEEQTLLAQAKALEVEALQLELKLGDIHASSPFCRQLSITGPIDSEVVQSAIMALAHWRRIDGDKPRDIHLVLNSLGEADEVGETFVNTFALYDYLHWMRQAGHKIIIQVTGTAGRQAVVLLQAADERVITANSALVLAEASFGGFRSDSSGAREQIRFRQDLQDQGWKLLVERTAGKLTMDRLLESTRHQRLWWLTGTEAQELGLVDRVGSHLQPAMPLSVTEIPATATDTALVRKQKAEQRLYLLKAEVARLEMEELAAQSMNPKMCYFFVPVTPGTVGMAVNVLHRLARKKGSEIELLINSPGGSVQDGLALMDEIEAVKASGVRVTTVALGQAASMGGFLLQSGDRRVMGKNARILIHRISRIFGGGASQLEEQEEHMRQLEQRALPLLAGRSKLSAEELRARSEHRDWWLTADQALELGFVDEVR